MPEKNYYTIREISKKVKVPQYTLRYWESKFKLLRPLRLKSGHRRYTRRDIEILNELKELVYEKGYSLKGAKKILFRKSPRVKEKIAVIQNTQFIGILDEIRKDLRALMREI